MDILLGIYSTSTFKNKLSNPNLLTYPFDGLVQWNNYDNNIMSIVIEAIDKCDRCYFILDEIKFEFSLTYSRIELNKY